MIRILRLCGALSILACGASASLAQTPPQDDVATILRRLEALEVQVAELRRQAGVQTAVETVARELRQRRPSFQKIKVAEPQPAGPSPAASGDVKEISDAEMLNPGEFKPPAPAPVPDRLALVVDGIEVRRQEIDDLVRFARSVVQGGDDAVLRHVLQAVLLPRLRAQSAAGAASTSILQLANELRQQVVDGGKDFAELAREKSQDAGTAAQGGALPALERSAQPMALAKAAFETGVGKVSPVVLSELGAHFLLVERKGKADPKNPSSPLVVNARQVLLAWPQATADRPAPRIELLDPSLRAALPVDAAIVDRTNEFGDQLQADRDASAAKQQALEKEKALKNPINPDAIPPKKGG